MALSSFDSSFNVLQVDVTCLGLEATARLLQSDKRLNSVYFLKFGAGKSVCIGSRSDILRGIVMNYIPMDRE